MKTSADGSKRWYENNLLHRLEGPAVEDPNGCKYWYVEGKRHRLDGPAIEYPGGAGVWFYQGEYIKCSNQQQFERLIKLKVFW